MKKDFGSLMLPSLPVEIVNRIFSYMSSPTAMILKQTLYYRHDLPFLLLRQGMMERRVHINKNLEPFNFEVSQDYFKIYSKILLHQHPHCERCISLFYVYTANSVSRRYSRDLNVSVRQHYFSFVNYMKIFCVTLSENEQEVRPNMIQYSYRPWFYPTSCAWLGLICMIVFFIMIGLN